MEKYDYKKAMIQDIREYIQDNNFKRGEESLDEYIEALEENLWDEDCITGNGPYWYGTEDECSTYLSGNFDLLYEAAYDFCLSEDVKSTIKHYEQESLARYFDCTIRCYLLNECIREVVEGDSK